MKNWQECKKKVTILILIDGFLQSVSANAPLIVNKVTILILIDGFLQYSYTHNKELDISSHNPYFNRWFSAITLIINVNHALNCHNPYFNRWFSAME